MSTSTKQPRWRTWCGAILVIVGRIGLFVCILQLLLDFVPPYPSPFMRALIGAVVSVLFVAAAAISLRDASVLWQVGLQTIALTGLVFGATVIYVQLRNDWHFPWNSTGIVGVSSLALGVATAALMRYGQTLHKRRKRKV